MGEKAMSFLNNKSFHPGNAQNRYKLFIAEEKKKAEDVRTEELSREYAQQEARRQLKSAITGGPDNSAVSFMYNAPPGLAESENRKKMAQLEKDKTPAERDVDRFGTLLANAPREGSYTTAMEVTHKPFGVELRKVRCTKCGQWGHQAGERAMHRRSRAPSRAPLCAVGSLSLSLSWAPGESTSLHHAPRRRPLRPSGPSSPLDRH